MLLSFLLANKMLWPVPFILQALALIGVLKKMGIPIWYAFIPGGADYQITKRLYPKTRTFWRPFFVSAVLVIAAYYLNPFSGTGRPMGRVFLIIAIVVYLLFLFRLYRRLSKAFGHGGLFAFFMFLIPPLGLAILGFGKSQYQGDPVFAPKKEHGPVLKTLGRIAYGAITVVEVLALIGVVGILVVRTYQPEFMVQMIQNEYKEKIQGLEGGDNLVTNVDALGDAAGQLASMPTSRDKFFADHSQDKNVVVYAYIVGSDLEDAAGFATFNIEQMIETTKQGSALSFVLETGGARRWIMPGIDDLSYGRYLIQDGKLEKIEELDSATCMSEQQTLADFISWGVENYPADRRMLVLWDHGGGLSSGYGIDDLNRREKKESGDMPMLSVAEICDAIKSSGAKFDMIGFDACLMQDIEIAAALEPYADYFLASEESEGGYGWFYTSPFGKLAQNPGMPTQGFGREIVACYDPYNRANNHGEANSMFTLSFIDLPLAKAAYESMDGLFSGAQAAIAADSKSFANVSLAGTKSYKFSGNEQIDLIDFLERLDQLDYEDDILSHDKIVELENAVKACVLYRNADSAEGINGMAFSFPVESTESYSRDYKQLKQLGFGSQTDLMNSFFSIIAVQKKKEHDSFDSDNANFIESVSNALYQDPSSEEWYVSGFENYDSTPTMLDIPLKEVADGYEIELPEAMWDIIADEQLVLYQKADDGLLRYLGRDTLGAPDDDSHPLLAMDGSWVHVGDKLVCYEAGESRVTDEGTVFTSTTRARLNDSVDIKLSIEWDPVAEGDAAPASGHIVGYNFVEVDETLEQIVGLFGESLTDEVIPKGTLSLKPGDRVDFMFDYYDSEGNVVATEAFGGTLLVSGQEKIAVEDRTLSSCEVEFYGLLTDVYQRNMSTERIVAQID